MGKLTLILGVAALLVVVGENAGAVSYTVTDMGLLGTGTASYAYGVNNSGVVAGYAYTTAGTGSPHAVVFNGTTTTDISASWSTPNARATAINDSGLVVGYLSTSPLHGFMYNGSTMTDMSTLPGELNGVTSRAFAVTSNGIIAGSGGTNGMGWVYDGTTSYAVGKISSSANNGTIFGVNNSQWAVGASMPGGIDPTTYPLYTYYNGTSWVAYKVYAGAGQATFINSSGTIVGSDAGSAVWGATGSNAWVATWGGSSYTKTNLPTLGGSFGNAAYAISDNGVAVGTSQNAGGTAKAFVATYSGSAWTTTDLNTLVTNLDGWNLARATAISTNGNYICGYGTIGGQTHGFLLTPVPEPSTIVLFGSAAIGLLGYAWRRRVK